MVTKKIFFGIVLLALTIVGCKDSKPETAQIKDEIRKPNILFLFTDDQRGGTIGAMDKYDVKTPNMDQLVEN